MLQNAGLEMVFPPDPDALMDRAKLIEAVRDVDAVVASVEPYDREFFAAVKPRVVARVGVGYDTVDVDAASEAGVPVTIAPGTNEHSVAELATSLMLGVFRGFPWRDQKVRRGEWDRTPLPRLAGKTLGLLGFGRIGRAMVGRAQGLGLNVVAYDPYPNAEFAAEHGVELLSMDALLGVADVVSLHLPATEETTDVINAESLAKMKPGAVLINTSRGVLVDEDALADALRSGRLWAAGLDVFKTEPLPLDSPLLQFEQVLMTPHVGGLDHQSIIDMSTLAARCVADLFQGRWPDECVVNKQLQSGWRW
ncbi:MAG: phosphoglycerate dehydrogenase [Planctomycetales bacterium]